MVEINPHFYYKVNRAENYFANEIKLNQNYTITDYFLNNTTFENCNEKKGQTKDYIASKRTKNTRNIYIFSKTSLEGVECEIEQDKLEDHIKLVTSGRIKDHVNGQLKN